MVLSSTTAIRFFTLSPVMRSNSRPPLASNVMETYGSLNCPIDTRASLSTSPVSMTRFLTKYGMRYSRPVSLSIARSKRI